MNNEAKISLIIRAYGELVLATAFPGELTEERKALLPSPESTVGQILFLVKKEIWEKAIRTEHDDMMMDWLDDLLSRTKGENE